MFEHIQKEISYKKDFLGSGATLLKKDSAERTAMLTAEIVGQINGMEYLLNLKTEEES